MKLLLILVLIFLNYSCSKDFSKDRIQISREISTAKVEGRHNVFISNENFELKKQILSEDCESWAVKLDFDQPLKNSVRNLLDNMLENYSISEKKLNVNQIEANNFVTQISFENFSGISNFKTERNTGIYEISLRVKVKVENSSKNIVNEISSNMNWEKNIFFNCDLHEGAVSSGQKALDNLIKKIYESTYESIFQITK